MESKIYKVTEIKVSKFKRNYAIRFVKMFVRDYAAMLLGFLLLCNVSLRHIKIFLSLSMSTDISSMAGALKEIAIALRYWKFSKTRK